MNDVKHFVALASQVVFTLMSVAVEEETSELCCISATRPVAFVAFHVCFADCWQVACFCRFSALSRSPQFEVAAFLCQPLRPHSTQL